MLVALLLYSWVYTSSLLAAVLDASAAEEASRRDSREGDRRPSTDCQKHVKALTPVTRHSTADSSLSHQKLLGRLRWGHAHALEPIARALMRLPLAPLAAVARLLQAHAVRGGEL